MSADTAAPTAAATRDTSTPEPPKAPRAIVLGATGRFALAVLALMILIAVLAPWIAPYDPNLGSLLDAYASPSPEHWLGTDATGRDIASRLIYGARTSLLGPAMIVLLALALSIPLSLVAVWRGGWVSTAINRAIDVVFAIPGLLLAILAVAVFGAGLTSVVAALAIAYVPFVARIVISAAQAQRRLPYVQVLTVQGVGPTRIMVGHVLRNIAPMLIGQATVTFAYALIDLAGMSFLGLGVQAPGSDWGVMVADRDSILQGHPMQVVAASIVIVVTVLSLLVLGSKLSGEETRTTARGWFRRKK